jgi:hypothetical protein
MPCLGCEEAPYFCDGSCDDEVDDLVYTPCPEWCEICYDPDEE